MQNKLCPAINHRSGGMSDPASHQRNAEEKESVNTFMTQPEIRESLLTRRNPSKRLSLNICIPGYDSSTSLCEPDNSGRNTPTRKIITKSAHATTPSTAPYRKRELQEPRSPNQPISDLLSTKIPCNKKEIELQDDTSSYFRNDATCRKNKPYPDKNPKSNLPQHLVHN